MTQPETRFKNRIRPHLEALNNTFVIKIQQVTVRGDPDFVLCVDGGFVGMELKRDAKAKPTALQRHKLELIDKAAGIAMVVCPETWDEAFRYLELLSQGIVEPMPDCLKP